jgi:hypothetical protein
MKKQKNKPNELEIHPGRVIKEIPVLFSGSMVKAIKSGGKTETRRIIKNVEITPGVLPGAWNYQWKKGKEYKSGFCIPKRVFNDPFLGIIEACPFGKPGDLLWVRENWTKLDGRVYFQADGAQEEIIEEHELDKVTWKPSIHLQKGASRIWLMVEEARAEQLQDITDISCRKEGIRKKGYTSKEEKWVEYFQIPGHPRQYPNAKDAFSNLWMTINGKESWTENPWVWMVRFRVLSTYKKPEPREIEWNYNQIVFFNAKK